MVRVLPEFVGHELRRARARPRRTSLPGASPVRLATRKMCVSTAIVGCAERDVQHDVRGLAADAGQRFERLASRRAPRRRARAAGSRDSATTFFALLRKRPIELMYGISPSTPSFDDRPRACWRPGNSRAVALLTLLSVACADSTTATSSSNGVRYSSSVVGCGLSARRRSKICAALRRDSLGAPMRRCRRELGEPLRGARLRWP